MKCASFIIFSFACVLTLPALGQDKPAQREQSEYIKAPEPMWEEFESLREAGKDLPFDPRVAQLLDLANRGEAAGHYDFAFRVHWYRRFLLAGKARYDEAIGASLEANRCFILYQNALGKESLGDMTEWTNLHNFYRTTGRMGLAFHAKQVLDQIHGEHERDDWGVARMPDELISSHYLNIVVYHQKLAGMPGDALNSYEAWADRVRLDANYFARGNWWRQGTIVTIMATLADLNDYLYYEDDARQWRKKLVDSYEPKFPYQAHNFYEQKLEYLLEQCRFQGADQALLADYAQAVKDLSECEGDYSKIKARGYEASLQSAQGNDAAALAIVEAILADPILAENVSGRANYLESRARYRLALEQTEGVLDDLENALQTSREQGYLLQEPSLYCLYARLNRQQGDLNAAFEYYQKSIQMYRQLGRPFHAVEVQVELLELYIELGDWESAEALWAQIAQALRHRKAPTSLKVKALMARARMSGPAPAQAAEALQSAQKLAVSRGMPQLVQQQPEQVAPTAPAPGQGETIRLVRLEPGLMTTRVQSGESARARYTISNLSQLPSTGQIQIAGPGAFSQDWDAEAGILTIKVSPANQPSQAISESVTIQPEEQLLIYLDTVSGDAGVQAFSVQWLSKPEDSADWQLEILPPSTDDARPIQVVNASRAAISPFHAIPFYHELYVRQSDRQFLDFRVRCSAPTRLEIRDPDTLALLAVDATGNGSFQDKGDVLTVDHNGNTFPDFDVARDQEVVTFEIHVFPVEAPNDDGSPVTIDVEILEGEKWVVEAQDWLTRE